MFKVIRTQINHGAVDPLKRSSSASITWSYSFRFELKAVNRYLPQIMSYLSLTESSTWKFHVTISVALSSNKAKFILTFRLLVILTACVCHCIPSSYFGLSFLMSLNIRTMKLHPISNKTWCLLDPRYRERIIITKKGITKCFTTDGVWYHRTYKISMVFPPIRQNKLHVIHLQGSMADCTCASCIRQDP